MGRPGGGSNRHADVVTQRVHTVAPFVSEGAVEGSCQIRNVQVWLAAHRAAKRWCAALPAPERARPRHRAGAEGAPGIAMSLPPRTRAPQVLFLVRRKSG